MNAEEMKRQAELEYAVRELNNAIESARKEKMDMTTCPIYTNCMHYMSNIDVMVVSSAGLECYIRSPSVYANGWKVAIKSNPAGNFMLVKPETVIGWLVELTEKAEKEVKN